MPCLYAGDVAQSSTVVGDTAIPLFVAPLGYVISRFGILYRQYADDTQLCIAVDHETARSASTDLAACTASISLNGSFIIA